MSCSRSINTKVPNKSNHPQSVLQNATQSDAFSSSPTSQPLRPVTSPVTFQLKMCHRSSEAGSSHSHTSPSCSVRTRTRTRPVTPAVGAVENQRRTTLLQKAPKQTPRHSNTQTSNEIYHGKHTQNISKRFQPKALTSSYWHPSQVYRIPFPCLRLHRSWEALMPRPLRQKPTFLIATGCCGKNCDMAYFTVEALILGCITNLMKSTHWKPVNFQNIQLGFMLTTSLLEGRLSVMSTLGKTPVIDGEEFTGTRGAEKKNYMTA